MREQQQKGLRRIQAIEESDFSSESELSDLGVSESEDESGGETVADPGPDVWQEVNGEETEDKRPYKHEFREDSGPQNISRNVRKPIDFFFLFFNLSLLQRVCFKQTCEKYDRSVAEGTK